MNNVLFLYTVARFRTRRTGGPPRQYRPSVSTVIKFIGAYTLSYLFILYILPISIATTATLQFIQHIVHDVVLVRNDHRHINEFDCTIF